MMMMLIVHVRLLHEGLWRLLVRTAALVKVLLLVLLLVVRRRRRQLADQLPARTDHGRPRQHHLTVRHHHNRHLVLRHLRLRLYLHSALHLIPGRARAADPTAANHAHRDGNLLLLLLLLLQSGARGRRGRNHIAGSVDKDNLPMGQLSRRLNKALLKTHRHRHLHWNHNGGSGDAARLLLLLLLLNHHDLVLLLLRHLELLKLRLLLLNKLLRLTSHTAAGKLLLMRKLRVHRLLLLLLEWLHKHHWRLHGLHVLLVWLLILILVLLLVLLLLLNGRGGNRRG